MKWLYCSWERRIFHFVFGRLIGSPKESGVALLGRNSFPSTNPLASMGRLGIRHLRTLFLDCSFVLAGAGYAAKLLFVWRAKNERALLPSPYEDNDKDSDIESLTDQPPGRVPKSTTLSQKLHLLHVLLTILLSAVALLCLAGSRLFADDPVLSRLLEKLLGYFYWGVVLDWTIYFFPFPISKTF